jgi:zinc protease
MRRDELLFAVTGPLESDEVDQAAASLQVSSEAEPLDAVDLTAPARPAGTKLIFVDKPERKQCQVLMGHLLPNYGSAAFDTLRVAETAFGGMFTSRLMQEIRAKNGWSYGAHASMIRAKGPHLLQIGLAPAVEVCPAAVERTMEMFGELVSEGLADEEFEFARSYLTGSAAFGRATARQRLFRQVQEQVFGLPLGFEDGFPDRIAELDNAQVSAALRQNFQPGNLSVVVVGTADTVLSKLEAIGFDEVEVHAYDSL